MCDWQFPPTNRAELLNFDLDYRNHSVARKFEHHAQNEHPGIALRAPEPRDLVRIIGTTGGEYEVMRTDVGKKTVTAKSVHLAQVQGDFSWADLSYVNREI